MTKYFKKGRYVSERVRQIGYTMVEILGVLAIIGVLSVGSLLFYNRSMHKNKVNVALELSDRIYAAIHPEIVKKIFRYNADIEDVEDITQMTAYMTGITKKDSPWKDDIIVTLVDKDPFMAGEASITVTFKGITRTDCEIMAMSTLNQNGTTLVLFKNNEPFATMHGDMGLEKISNICKQIMSMDVHPFSIKSAFADSADTWTINVVYPVSSLTPRKSIDIVPPGQACPDGKFNFSGRCYDCDDPTRHKIDGTCCPQGLLSMKGICCPTGKHGNNGFCYDCAETARQKPDGTCCPTDMAVQSDGSCGMPALCPDSQFEHAGKCYDCDDPKRHMPDGTCCPKDERNIDGVCAKICIKGTKGTFSIAPRNCCRAWTAGWDTTPMCAYATLPGYGKYIVRYLSGHSYYGPGGYYKLYLAPIGPCWVPNSYTHNMCGDKACKNGSAAAFAAVFKNAFRTCEFTPATGLTIKSSVMDDVCSDNSGTVYYEYECIEEED